MVVVFEKFLAVFWTEKSDLTLKKSHKQPFKTLYERVRSECSSYRVLNDLMPNIGHVSLLLVQMSRLKNGIGKTLLNLLLSPLFEKQILLLFST